MTARASTESHVYLNALVSSNNSMEVRTRVFSKSNLDSLLSERPAAITVSSSGALDPERLLEVYTKHHALFRPIIRSRRVYQWRCYAQEANDKRFELKELLDQAAVIRSYTKLLKRLFETAGEPTVCALVPALEYTSQHDKQIRTALFDALVVTSKGDKLVFEAKRRTNPTVTGATEDDPTDREALIRVRRQMLDMVGSYSSEDMAAAAESTTTNPSQFAADQRATGEIFGVRFGQQWHYPKFQFDAKRHIIPETKAVLQALSPDEQGWDRLQWFLEPHETLAGRTPLQVWKKDRQKVIEAAQTERWDGRD